MDLEERCLNQVMKPKTNLPSANPPGWGNCYTCTYSEDNKKCAGYYPIRINIYEVK